MVNAQQWLESQEEYNTKEKRSEITELNINHKELEGNLDLNGFINLKKLSCCVNKLTSLDLTSCDNLEEIDCFGNQLTNLTLPRNLFNFVEMKCNDNQLTSLDFSVLNPEKLKELDISNNNFSESNLSIFAPFVNLEVLKIGSDYWWNRESRKEKIEKNIYNRFHGSLEPLKDLNKLRELRIDNTDINGGSEYLSNSSLEMIGCSTKERPDSKVKEILEPLSLIESKQVSGQQLKFWMDFGLSLNDYGFATYLTKQNYQFQTNLKLEELKQEYYDRSQKSQDWLNKNYPKENRSKVQEIHLNESTLEGELDLKDFTYWDSNSKCGVKISVSTKVDEKKLVFRNLFSKFTKIIKCVDAWEWLENNYPKNSVCIRETPNEKEYEKDNKGWNNKDKTRTEITKLDISDQKLEGRLDLSDFVNLEELECQNNKFDSLNIFNCSQLELIRCNDNLLSVLFLPLNPTKLKKLFLGNNDFSSQDLSFLEKVTNSEELFLGNNKFTGSLKFLKKIENLKYLDISDTDIDKGLEYLPESVETVYCPSVERPEARVSDIWEELRTYDGDLKAWRKTRLDKQIPLTVSPLLPPQLIGENVQKGKFAKLVKQVQRQNRENKLLANISKINYDKIHFENWPRNNESEIFTSEQLPTRLYNIQEDKIEETKNNSGIKSYAILSYVWGNPNIEATEEMKNYSWWKDNLTVSGNKSLQKAIQACNLLGINHIWIDQLCIIQKGDEAIKDKENEIPKMRQYYSNAEITLITLNDEVGGIKDGIDLMDILRKVVDSEWFERSWTFQEGWLSKHTVFMFDDKLIDGWAVAGTWVLHQPSYVDTGKYLSWYEFNKGTKKIATPLGWVYCRDGYTEEDKVTMTLNQALKEIKKRGRSVPVDGIYSILGLLPYGGDKGITIDYSKNNTPEKALMNIMKVANENGYAEPVAWHGSAGTSWLPRIDEHGSTNIEGGLEVKGSVEIYGENGENIGLQNTSYQILEVDKDIHKRESGFEIEGGLYERKVSVEGNTKIVLLGTKETMKLVEKETVLALFTGTGLESARPLALLVKDSGSEINITGDYGIFDCHRLGLVELGAGVEKLKIKGLLEGSDGAIISHQIQEQQSQIEIPPK